MSLRRSLLKFSVTHVTEVQDQTATRMDICSWCQFVGWKAYMCNRESLGETTETSTWLSEYLVCFLLVGPDLWKSMPLKCSINMVFTYLLLCWCKISSPFRESNNMVVFLLLFHIFIPCGSSAFKDSFPS